MRLHLSSALLLTAVVATAACSGQATSPSTEAPGIATPSDPAATSAAADRNAADVAFLEGMIPHHEQAVEMAELVEGHTDRPELMELAATIIATQTEEIATMRELLGGAEPSEGRMDEGGHAGDTMPGMMSSEDMDRLGMLEGEEFDLAFLDMMTAHHEGAIQQATEVLDSGQAPEVAELAEAIIQAQQAEIEQMAAWEAEWSA